MAAKVQLSARLFEPSITSSIHKTFKKPYLYTDFFVWGGQRADDNAFRVKRGRRVNFYIGYSEKCPPQGICYGGGGIRYGGGAPPIMGGAYTYATRTNRHWISWSLGFQ